MQKLLDIAAWHLSQGRLDDAEGVCHALLAERAEEPQALHLLATTANRRKAHLLALDFARRAIKGGGDPAPLLVERATAHFGLGDVSAALRDARQAIEHHPRVIGAYGVIANILLPGQWYLAMLERLHEHLKPRNYLEIGVARGDSFALVKPPTVAVGIDPQPELANAPPTPYKIFPLTSDEYFARRDLRTDIEGDALDLTFIDGLHLFEQALRDFINVERYAHSGSAILLHDCLPVDALVASREQKTVFWTGDVWKVMLCLRDFRPDLDIFMIPTAPSGLAIVRALDPHSRVLDDNYDRIIARYLAMEFDADAEQQLGEIAKVPNTWNDVIARLNSRTLPPEGGALRQTSA